MAPRREDRLRRRGRRATILGVGPLLLGLLALVSSNLLVWGWTVGPGKGGVAGAVHQDDQATPRRRPIILVPGLAASKLEVKVDERYEFPEGCEGSGEPGRWELNWMNLNSVLKIKCFGDKLRLVYGRREVHDGPLRRALRLVFGPARREEVVPVDRIGVEVRPRDFGGLGGVTSMLHAFGTTFAVDKMTNFVRGLQRLGWVEGENLYGAPFDWRYAPSRSGATAFQNFDRDLTALVEEAVQKTGLRAVLLGHSLGGLMLTNFLSRKQRAWKEKHVEAFVPMSVPFGGAARSIKSILIGDNGNVPFLPMDYFGALQRTCTSGLWLLPRPRAFGEERVLFRAGGKNYTASMVGELLSDTGLEDQREVLEREIGQLDTWLGLEKGGLGVRTLCVISSGVKTLSSLVLDSPVEDLAANPRGASYTIEAEDDGDGIVNLSSLRQCAPFADEVVELGGLGHRTILSSKRTLEVVAAAATATTGAAS